MATQNEIREAFQKADAIMRLEGFESTQTCKALQEAVTRGTMTFDDAVKSAIRKYTPAKPAGGA